MAKLLLLLVFVCFQFSSQEELAKPENELGNPEILLGKPENELVQEEPTATATEVLVEPTKPEREPKKEAKKKFDDEWTEEDEKWLQEIIDLLTGKSEDEDDDDDDDDDFDSSELYDYYGESNESYLYDSHEYDDKWYDDEDDDSWYFEYDWETEIKGNNYKNKKREGKKEDGAAVQDKPDLYYSWLHGKMRENADKQKKPTKRFTSV